MMTANTAALGPARLACRAAAVAVRLAAPLRNGVRCTYAGVLDGDALWLSLDLPRGSAEPRLVMRARSSDHTIALPLNTSDSGFAELCVDLARHAAAGRLIEGVYDMFLTFSGRELPVLVVGDALRPRDPTTTPPSRDGCWRFKPVRASAGNLAVRVRRWPLAAEVVRVSADGRGVGLDVAFVGAGAAHAASDPPSKVRLLRRSDSVALTAPTHATAEGFAVDIKPDQLLGLGRPGVPEVWELLIAVGGADLALGRRLTDIARLQSAQRYRMQHTEDGSSFRPYFTKGRNLVLEVTCGGVG